ncbi:MAG: tetratricopeptide repeat protein [Chitinispirillia bacterium]|nr:tetratricopeptide repeat protein [Chitinispirillia bacterium]
MAAKAQMSAIQVLEEQLRFNPQSRAFSRLADKYRIKGDVGQAISLCLEGLAEHPNYVTGRLVLGRCYAEQKNFQAAIEEFKKVCVADKRNHAALKMLADIFIKLGRAEEAGGLYRILFEMEPDNPAVKNLSTKHPSSIQGNVFDILGIKPINVASSVKDLKSFGIDDADIQNMDTIQSETPYAAPAAPAVHNNTSTILTSDLLPAQSNEPTGSDIENQLNSMFGEIGTETVQFSSPMMPAAPPAPQSGSADIFASSTDEPSGSDIENQLDAMFGDVTSDPFPSAEVAAPAPQSGSADMFALSTDEPSGSDIENQLDAMFGDITPDPLPSSANDAPAPQSGSADMFALSTDEPTGNDVADQFDAMFGSDNFSDSADAGLLENNETGIFTMTTGDEPTGDDIENQLDSLFGNSISAPPSAPQVPAADEIDSLDTFTAAADEPSGDDIENRLDLLFAEPDSASSAAESGEQDMVFFDSGMETANNSATPPASSIPTIDENSDSGEVTGEDVENQLSSLFGAGAFQTSIDDNDPILSNEQYDIAAIIAEEMGGGSTDTPLDTAAGEQEDVSGDDISSRIDQLFAQHGDGNIAPDFSDFSDADGAAIESSSAVSDFNYTENVDSEINDLIAAAHDSVEDLPLSSPLPLSAGSAPIITEELPVTEDIMQDAATADSGINDLIAAELNSLESSVEENSITESLLQDFTQDITENSSENLMQDTDAAISGIGDLIAAELNSIEESSPQDIKEDYIQNITPDNSIIDSAVINDDEVSGDDIEARLKDLFNVTDTVSTAVQEESANQFEEAFLEQPLDNSIVDSFDTVSSSLFTDESPPSENIFANELIDTGSTGSDLIDTAEQPYMIDGDDVQEKIRQLFKSGVSETETIDIGANFGDEEIDERDADAALELPDHVLTPTLADIYFQQGQPKLSLQIYERLALRDPKDPRLQSKIQEIKDLLGSEADTSESTKKKTR